VHTSLGLGDRSLELRGVVVIERRAKGVGLCADACGQGRVVFGAHARGFQLQLQALNEGEPFSIVGRNWAVRQRRISMGGSGIVNSMIAMNRTTFASLTRSLF
jgi:hypothetical protein